MTLDDIMLYPQVFDERAFLVQGLGIPESSSVTVLGFGDLLLTRCRQAVLPS